MGEVPKWKIGCLNVCAVLAMVFVVIGIFAPKLPAPAAAAPEPVTAAPEPVAPIPAPEPAPAPVTPAPAEPTLTDAHRAAIRSAIVAAGLPAPSYIGQERKTIEIQYHAGEPVSDEYAEHLGMAAVKAARNTIYILPDADKDWVYNVSVWGPAPGPDMDPDFMGLAYMSTNLYRWSAS